MLPDPLIVKSISLTSASTVTVGSTETFTTRDSANGASVRKLSESSFTGFPLTLTIKHGSSNENKPVKTDRSLIRLDAIVKDSAGKEMNAYAYIVIGTPHGGYTSEGDVKYEPKKLVELLMGLLSRGVNPSVTTTSDAALLRLLDQEP